MNETKKVYQVHGWAGQRHQTRKLGSKSHSFDTSSCSCSPRARERGCPLFWTSTRPFEHPPTRPSGELSRWRHLNDHVTHTIHTRITVCTQCRKQGQKSAKLASFLFCLTAVTTDYKYKRVPKKGQSWDRTIFQVDRGLYQLEKTIGINLILVTVSQ
jgi:hypothetical protein